MSEVGPLRRFLKRCWRKELSFLGVTVCSAVFRRFCGGLVRDGGCGVVVDGGGREVQAVQGIGFKVGVFRLDFMEVNSVLITHIDFCLQIFSLIL